MAEEDTAWEIFGEESDPTCFVGFGTVARILKSVIREGEKEAVAHCPSSSHHSFSFRIKGTGNGRESGKGSGV